jgi:hypothetical protein
VVVIVEWEPGLQEAVFCEDDHDLDEEFLVVGRPPGLQILALCEDGLELDVVAVLV